MNISIESTQLAQTDLAEAVAHRRNDVVGLTHQDIRVESAEMVGGVLPGIRPDMAVRDSLVTFLRYQCEAA
jgi:hypothetical protein